jgi:cytochrome c oxidase cbb3-type subunit 3
MNHRAVWFATGFAIVLAGCGDKPEQYVLPDQISDFSALYANNCAGCHGADGRFGAARPLNDPLYLALIGKQRLREVIAKGVPETAMPAFAQSAGGALTDRQLTVLADQIEARWSRPQQFAGVVLPPYNADAGDPEQGHAVFNGYCSRCHGADGTGASKGASVVDPGFLALVSDQSLRSSVIAGRADQNVPDWRSDSPDHAMTPQEISDVVAWLSSHRALPGNLAKARKALP